MSREFEPELYDLPSEVIEELIDRDLRTVADLLAFPGGRHGLLVELELDSTSLALLDELAWNSGLPTQGWFN